MSVNNIVISYLDHKYLSQIVEIHLKALRGDILPAIGKSFVKEYYNFVSSRKSQLVIGIFIDGHLVGFCQIALKSIAFFPIILSNVGLIFTLIKFMVLHPILFLIANIDMVNRYFSNTRNMYPEISFIALLPEHQNRGYGTALVSEANKILKEKGYKQIFTKTHNLDARKMYEKKFSAKIVTKVRMLTRSYWYLSWIAH